MKNILKPVTCALIALIVATNSSAALAANLRFAPQPATNGGAIYGRIPLSKFGVLNLPRGRASFKSHFVEISAVAEYSLNGRLCCRAQSSNALASIAANNL
jgi:hypothetical protein